MRHDPLKTLILDALESERRDAALLDALLTDLEPEVELAPVAPTTPLVVKPQVEPLRSKAGRAKVGILLWLLGVPLPIILLIWLVKGCV